MNTQEIKARLSQLQNCKADVLDLRIMMLGYINDLIALRSQNRDWYEHAIRSCQSLYKEIPTANSFITQHFRQFKVRFAFLLSQMEDMQSQVAATYSMPAQAMG